MRRGTAGIYHDNGRLSASMRRASTVTAGQRD